jgi:hypothetical protein
MYSAFRLLPAIGIMVSCNNENGWNLVAMERKDSKGCNLCSTPPRYFPDTFNVTQPLHKLFEIIVIYLLLRI